MGAAVPPFLFGLAGSTFTLGVSPSGHQTLGVNSGGTAWAYRTPGWLDTGQTWAQANTFSGAIVLGSTFSAATGTFSGAITGGSTASFAGVISGSNATIATGTITTSQPLTLTQTWNASGVAFTGFKIGVMNTASAAASIPIDVQVGGVSKFQVDLAGSVYSALTNGNQYGFGTIAGSTTGFQYLSGLSGPSVNASGATTMGWHGGTGNTHVGASYQIGFTTSGVTGTFDMGFGRTGNDAIYLRAQRTTSVGPTLTYQGNSTTTAGRAMLDAVYSWATATDASRKARATYSVYDTAARECMRFEASGSASMLSFHGSAAVAQQVLATGAGASVDNVITLLQLLGLCKQS